MNGIINIRRLSGLLMLLPLVYVLSACATPLTYSAEAIEAKVVDAETKKPIDGVIVVANWQLKEGTLGGSVPAGQLMVMEATTETNGRFDFPAWGPRTTWKGHLVNQDPQLLLYKPGYRYRRLVNAYSSTRESRLRRVRQSDWDGKMIALRRMSTDSVQFKYENLVEFSFELEALIRKNPCEWTNFLEAVKEVNQERKALIARGATPSPGSRTLDRQLLDDKQYFLKCGDIAIRFFGEVDR